MWGLELLVDMLGQADPASPLPNPPLHLIESEDDMTVSSGNI
jgi:hypothetical protein